MAIDISKVSVLFGDVIVDFPTASAAYAGVVAALAAHPFGKDIADDLGTVEAILEAVRPLAKVIQSQATPAAPAAAPAK